MSNIAMALDRKADLTPTQRAVFEAVDASVRSNFTGKVIVEVVAGKAQSIISMKVRESEYPQK